MTLFKKEDPESEKKKQANIEMLKAMILKEKGDMDFITDKRPKLKKGKNETAKAMDFILR